MDVFGMTEKRQMTFFRLIISKPIPARNSATDARPQNAPFWRFPTKGHAMAHCMAAAKLQKLDIKV